jgi:hypothetical protein
LVLRCSVNFEKEHFFGSANLGCSGNFNLIYRTISRTQNQKNSEQKKRLSLQHGQIDVQIERVLILHTTYVLFFFVPGVGKG